MEKKKAVKRTVKICEKYLMLILIAALFMSIAYATVSDIKLTIVGSVTTEGQSGVYISNVEEVASNGLISQEVKYYKGTTISTSISLSSESTSSLTYKISLHNNSASEYYFTGVTYDEYGYDNDNIDFDVNMEPYLTTISADSNMDFNIEFKYKDGATVETNQELNSLLIFGFNNEYIDFTLLGKKLTVPKGMTWEQFVESNYNSYGIAIKNKIVYTSDNEPLLLSGKQVKATDTITKAAKYVDEITFKIARTTFKAKYGMTIGEWAISEYVTSPFTQSSNVATNYPVIIYNSVEYYIIPATSSTVDDTIVIEEGTSFRLMDINGNIYTLLDETKISFTIDGTQYVVEKGTTWANWIYNNEWNYSGPEVNYNDYIWKYDDNRGVIVYMYILDTNEEIQAIDYKTAEYIS